MKGRVVNPANSNHAESHHPIQMTINYWEIKPTQMGARLTELLRLGVTHVAAFLPWQAVESDITHSLLRFLQAAAERRMSVSLILTPEVGVHYANSGLPKDVIGRKDNSAAHAGQGSVPVTLPPNAFALPSLLAPELNKRFSSYLSRLDGFFQDLLRNHSGVLDQVNVILTGSFWKYYRTPSASALKPFAGVAGDYAPISAVGFRQKLEAFLSQREFMEPTPAAANRWKTRGMEEVNRRWFYQSSEDAFRARTLTQVTRKSQDLSVTEVELFTPEADPSALYANYLQMISGGYADFAQLAQLVEESCTRAGNGVRGTAETFIHWSSMGGYRTLSDPEKQFLFLKSLLMAGAQGGGVFIDESEWFAFSAAFRARAEAIARRMAHEELELRNQVVYLTPHLWSRSGPLWSELLDRVGAGARMVASIESVLREPDSPLLVVDPSQVFTRELVIKLLAWARGGRVVVLPRTTLFTDAARRELEGALNARERMELDLGVPYTIQLLGDGKLVLYDRAELSEANSVPAQSWGTFVQAMLALAGVESYCRTSDDRLRVVPLHQVGGELALFVLNSTRRAVTADVLFSRNVEVRDLALKLAQEGATSAAEGEAEQAAVIPASRFTLEVPPFGILPLRVSGLSLNDQREKKLAIEAAEATALAASDAAIGELAGFEEMSASGGDFFSNAGMGDPFSSGGGFGEPSGGGGTWT